MQIQILICAKREMSRISGNHLFTYKIPLRGTYAPFQILIRHFKYLSAISNTYPPPFDYFYFKVFFWPDTPISHFLFLGLSKLGLFSSVCEYRTLLLEGDGVPLKPPASKGVVFYLRRWALLLFLFPHPLQSQSVRPARARTRIRIRTRTRTRTRIRTRGGIGAHYYEVAIVHIDEVLVRVILHLTIPRIKHIHAVTQPYINSHTHQHIHPRIVHILFKDFHVNTPRSIPLLEQDLKHLTQLPKLQIRTTIHTLRSQIAHPNTLPRRAESGEVAQIPTGLSPFMQGAKPP